MILLWLLIVSVGISGNTVTAQAAATSIAIIIVMTTRSQLMNHQQHVHQPTSLKTVFVRDLNSFLCCELCDGYFREAHTISECLHTFCKVCLYTEFDKRSVKESKYCPTCNTNIGLNPYTKVVFDRNLQAIVDKVFPQFAEQERLLDEQATSSSSHTNSRSGTSAGGDTSVAGLGADGASSVGADGNQLPRPQLFPQTGAQKRSYAHIEGTSGSTFINQGSIKSSLYSHQLSQLAQHTQPVKRQALGGTYHGSSSNGSGGRQLGSYHAPALAAAVEPVDAHEPFMGLTLRVVPCDVDSSATPTERILPSLSKPLLRVTARSVGIDKIQRFIHKRMLAQIQTHPDCAGAVSTVGLIPEHIEILRDGIPMQATSSIGSRTGAGAAAEDVIVLHYRKLLVATSDSSSTAANSDEVESGCAEGEPTAIAASTECNDENPVFAHPSSLCEGNQTSLT